MNTAEKLTLLADHLEAIPAKAIRLEYWKCGTVACAVGHACQIPEFQKMGLEIEPSFHFPPLYNERTGWSAVRAFFEIDNYEADFLFSIFDYNLSQLKNPKRHVIKRLRKFVELRKAS